MLLAVGALEHVAQERRADAAALQGGDRRQELAVVQRLRRVVPLEGLSQLDEALDVRSDELLQRLAERLLLVDGQQLGARRQPHRGAVAVSGEVRLAETDVGCDVQLEHRLDESLATVLVGQQPPSSPGRRRTRRRRWRRRRPCRLTSVRRMPRSVADVRVIGCAPVSGTFGSTMTAARPPAHRQIYPLRRTRPCCTANRAAAARVDTPILV